MGRASGGKGWGEVWCLSIQHQSKVQGEGQKDPLPIRDAPTCSPRAGVTYNRAVTLTRSLA